ncbi:Uncharacterized protein APZ42_012772 [Daphnia magna]|uniref:Uncharacterized protein n=1 Tax=Daphnia magna TaxID=35525 RepID=A0A162RHP6_9CRUS|nr:Uncharacterized protein APZ42_012772 [Daphnia magna]
MMVTLDILLLLFYRKSSKDEIKEILTVLEILFVNPDLLIIQFSSIMGAPSRRCLGRREGSVWPCASVQEPVVRKVVDHWMLTSYLWVKIYLTWLKFDKGHTYFPRQPGSANIKMCYFPPAAGGH